MPGFDSRTIEFVMEQGNCNKEAALTALTKHSGNMFEAVLDVGFSLLVTGNLLVSGSGVVTAQATNINHGSSNSDN